MNSRTCTYAHVNFSLKLAPLRVNFQHIPVAYQFSYVRTHARIRHELIARSVGTVQQINAAAGAGGGPGPAPRARCEEDACAKKLKLSEEEVRAGVAGERPPPQALTRTHTHTRTRGGSSSGGGSSSSSGSSSGSRGVKWLPWTRRLQIFRNLGKVVVQIDQRSTY